MTITVAGAGAENRPPVAVPDAARTRVEQSVQIPVLANDTDPDNDLLTITDATLTDPRRGEVRVSGRSILFVPAASAAGLVLIEYTISDGNGGEDTGKVLVVVLPGNQENGPPVAAPDEISSAIPDVGLRPDQERQGSRQRCADPPQRHPTGRRRDHGQAVGQPGLLHAGGQPRRARSGSAT